MRVTVIICTFNRCDNVKKTLESVTASVLAAPYECEVLVVDNNSTDRTREVVEEYCRQHAPVFRYMFESRQGKSFALNAGIRASRGDVLAFLDDDVVVEPAWIEKLTAPLSGSEWAGTGGRTLLANPYTPPSWLAIDGPEGMGGILAAVFDLGDNPRELDRAPYGANMAYRKQMFEKYGLFRTDLGPSASRKTPRPNEDTEFGRRLIGSGERLRYEPSAVAYHPLHEDRVRKRYLLSWWFDFGRAQIREKGRGTPVFGIPRHYLGIPKMIALTIPQFICRWWSTFNPQKRFFAQCLTWSMAGQVAETWRLANESQELHPDYKPEEVIDQAS